MTPRANRLRCAGRSGESENHSAREQYKHQFPTGPSASSPISGRAVDRGARALKVNQHRVITAQDHVASGLRYVFSSRADGGYHAEQRRS